MGVTCSSDTQYTNPYSTAQATVLLILVTEPILFFTALVSRQAILFSEQSVLGRIID